MVSLSEEEDFNTAVKQAGHAPEEFELSQTQGPFPAQGVGAITGNVTVRNRKTGIERTYRAGYGSTWVIDFEGELRAGMFTR